MRVGFTQESSRIKTTIGHLLLYHLRNFVAVQHDPRDWVVVLGTHPSYHLRYARALLHVVTPTSDSLSIRIC